MVVEAVENVPAVEDKRCSNRLSALKFRGVVFNAVERSEWEGS